MTGFSPIDQIPEHWSKKVQCPICLTPTISILHFNSAADQMTCNVCAASFMIETQGKHIRFEILPAKYPETLRGKWITRNEIKQIKSDLQKEDTGIAGESNNNLSNDHGAVDSTEAINRAKQLMELGNSADAISRALEISMKLSPEDAREVVDQVSKLHDEQRKLNQRKILIITALIAGFLIVCFVAGAILF